MKNHIKDIEYFPIFVKLERSFIEHYYLLFYTMQTKLTYVKPQSGIVGLPAPSVLVVVTSLTDGPEGEWESSLPFFQPQDFNSAL